MKTTNKWEEDKESENTFYKIKKINNTYYRVAFTVNFYNKSVKIYIGATSGTKRKHLKNYEINDYPRDGGIKALFWIKEEIDKIPEFLDKYYIVDDRNVYLCIQWTDSQRRDVYGRLLREGFQFMIEGGEKTLIKKITGA